MSGRFTKVFTLIQLKFISFIVVCNFILVLDYVIKHWQENDFYGSQFLNGINPNVIKSCSKLPPNFMYISYFNVRALQLQQEPSEENPIFLPSDSESDWLQAKMFIKNADALDHPTVHHLMNTHFLAEVYTVATCCNLSEAHPVYKVFNAKLKPNCRFCFMLTVLSFSRYSC